MNNQQQPDSGATPNGQLDPVEMNEMISFYANNIAPVLTELKKTRFPEIDHDIPDATSAWISFSQIEKFIADNRTSGKANGMRIYYGVHTRDSFPGDPSKNQKGQHNIIFVPTSSRDEDPTYLNSKNIVRVTGSPDSNQIDDGNGSGDTGYALDHVAVCPPLCPTT